MIKMNENSIVEAVGGSYGKFWNFKGRYRVLKGGRGSKKSTTAALWLIHNMMFYWTKYHVKPNALVLRRYYITHRNSTFAQLQWAIDRLGVKKFWKATQSPLELTFIPSGQKIIFRGLDDPMSITSIVCAEGHLCWTWWEEAFQITDESAFDKVDLSIRGQLPSPLFMQHTITLNPWSDKHWIKRRFFDEKSTSILAQTRNYDCNEFLSDADRAIFEEMKSSNPRRFAIEGCGEWGISEGLIFENWRVESFDADALAKTYREVNRPQYVARFGMDFGFSQDPTAFVYALVDEVKREIYICAEIYKTHMLIDDMFNEVKKLGFENAEIVADSAQPGTIEELKKRGLRRIKGAKKGQNSVRDGIAMLQDYTIIIHPRCVNAAIEFSNYVWEKDKLTSQLTSKPMDGYDHLIDALRYATEGLGRVAFRWN